MKQLGKVLFTASEFAQCLTFYETLLCIKKQSQEKGIGVNWRFFTLSNLGWSLLLCGKNENYTVYSTLNKITQFWLVESSTINPKLYSVGVPIKIPWKRRNFVKCTINKKSHDLLVQFVNNRYLWFWKFSNCTRLKTRAILRTFKITRTH